MSIETFNDVIDQMTSALVDAKNQQEADAIAADFDKKIEEAEKQLELFFESEIKRSNDEIEKEFLQSLPDNSKLTKDETVNPITTIILNNDDDTAARILSVLEVRKLAGQMGLSTQGNEKELIQLIRLTLNENR